MDKENYQAEHRRQTNGKRSMGVPFKRRPRDLTAGDVSGKGATNEGDKTASMCEDRRRSRLPKPPRCPDAEPLAIWMRWSVTRIETTFPPSSIVLSWRRKRMEKEKVSGNP
jgi:hypothetical protein